jgi:hypothetical protein
MGGMAERLRSIRKRRADARAGRQEAKTRAAHARALGDPNPDVRRRHGERFTKGPDIGGGGV